MQDSTSEDDLPMVEETNLSKLVAKLLQENTALELDLIKSHISSRNYEDAKLAAERLVKTLTVMALISARHP